MLGNQPPEGGQNLSSRLNYPNGRANADHALDVTISQASCVTERLSRDLQRFWLFRHGVHHSC